MATAVRKLLKSDLRVAADIREYGCHVITVFDPEGVEPTFSYSVGLQETTGKPEAIVIGVRPELGLALINRYSDQIQNRKRFRRGTRYSGFLGQFKVYIEPAKITRAQEFTLGCERYYASRRYEVVQIVYPTVEGVWPWEKAASQWFVSNQPMLGRRRPDRA